MDVLYIPAHCVSAVFSHLPSRLRFDVGLIASPMSRVPSRLILRKYA